MEQQAAEIIGLIKAGVEKLGDVAPHVWELMVWYHWAQHLAQFIVIPAVGALAVFASIKWGWMKIGSCHDNDGYIAIFLVGLIGGTVMVVGGLLANFADVLVPEAGLIVKLISGK